MKNKKAMEMPIKLIISAAMVLFVVFLILFAVGQKTNIASKSLSSCELKEGECINISTIDCDGVISYDDCSNETLKCCLKLT